MVFASSSQTYSLLPSHSSSALSDISGAFVLGSGRCGSTLISNIIRSHPDILSLSEFFTNFASRAFSASTLTGEEFWQLLSERSPAINVFLHKSVYPEYLYEFDGATSFTDETLPPILATTLPHLTDAPDRLYQNLENEIRTWSTDSPPAHYQRLFEDLARRYNRSMWLERSGASLIYARALIRYYPNAKFVHIYRDGRDVALSMKSHGAFQYLIGTWWQMKKFGIDILKRPFRIGESHLVAWTERLAIPLFRLNRHLNQDLDLEICGKFWNALIREGRRDLERLPKDRLYVLRYEDLLENPYKEISKLMYFLAPSLAVPAWLEEAERLVRKTPPRWKSLPPSDQRRLTAACEPGLSSLGYL